MTKPLFIQLVTEEQTLPDDYSLRAITVQTRSYLGSTSGCKTPGDLERPAASLPRISNP